MDKDYSDIIDMPHHVSDKHLPMPIIERAGQFLSFAALRGHKEMLEETGRIVSEEKDN
ncbi:MAG: hypothetical protein K6G26_02735 [Lachnospiraceae bacterium]|jgi:hypothetical protein|nr:hypothetical protein [Lachnospiraceae bacterium]